MGGRKSWRIDELREQIKAQAEHVGDLKSELDICKRKLNEHTRTLHRLCAMTGIRNYGTRYSKPNVGDGLEWYLFDTAVKYGVELEGAGWYLSFGRTGKTKAKSATFCFNIRLDPSNRKLLKSLLPKASFRKRGKEIVCSDIPTALSLSQMVGGPAAVVWSAEVEAEGVARHTRTYVTKSTANIRIVRNICGE